MTYRIKSITHDGRELFLSELPYNMDNTFTIITGKNSTGKSRLLSKAINSSIFSKSTSDVKVFEFSKPIPNKVIAISTGRFDRFPTYVNAKKNKDFNNNYHYYGVKTTTNSPHATLTKYIASVFYGMEVDYNKLERLSYLFNYLGFKPIMRVSFSLYLNVGLLNDGRYEEFFADFIERNKYKDPLFMDKIDYFMQGKDISEFSYFVKRHLDLLSLRSRNKTIHFTLVFDEAKYGFIENIDIIMPLIELNILQVKDVHLDDMKTKESHSFFHCSSGQQCMMLMMMGIVSSIENDSLICIDEPEISLHPEWQLEFITLLQKLFSPYKGCHFLIATHSPQIVSGVIDSNGYIFSLERDILISAREHFMKSADFQLAEIFNAPGFRNEYLIRTLLVIISKISKENELTSSDYKNIELANSLIESLSSSDPVLYLLKQVNMLVGKK